MDRFLLRVQQRGWGWPFAILSIAVTSVVWWGVYSALDHHPAFHGHPVLLLVHPAILVTSIVIHELGHWAMMRRAGFDPLVFTMVVGGATYVPDRIWRERRPLLTLGQEVAIHLGGPLASLGLLTLAWAATTYGPWRPVAEILCYLNGWILLTNLLPIPGLDGGRFCGRMYGRHSSHDYSRLGDRVWTAIYLGLMLTGYAAIQVGHVL